MKAFILQRVDIDDNKEIIGAYKTEQRAMSALEKDFKEQFEDDYSFELSSESTKNLKLFDVYDETDLNWGEGYILSILELV